MIAIVLNKIISGKYVYYDALFYHETEKEPIKENKSLSGMIFNVNDTEDDIKKRVRDSFFALYTEETLNEITILEKNNKN
jgi:hypothetical protein